MIPTPATNPEAFPFAGTEPGGIINSTTLSYPHEGHPTKSLHLTYVLVRGGCEDVAVYVGAGSPQWVVSHGVKLRYKEAICHFPWLEARWYRR